MTDPIRISGRPVTWRAASLVLLALGATACARHSVSSRVAPVARVRSAALDVVAEAVLQRTNTERHADGMPPLSRSEVLMRAARIQAEQMAAAGRMEHELDGAPYPTLTRRLAAVSYDMQAAGENIAEGYVDASSVVGGWMTSPGHRANILSASYSEIGTGVAAAPSGRMYYVQVFARPMRLAATTTASR
jgi:uncharacterized protein YkwD